MNHDYRDGLIDVRQPICLDITAFCPLAFLYPATPSLPSITFHFQFKNRFGAKVKYSGYVNWMII